MPLSIAWALLLKRVFKIDLTTCHQCSGDVRVLESMSAKEDIEHKLLQMAEWSCEIAAAIRRDFFDSTNAKTQLRRSESSQLVSTANLAELKPTHDWEESHTSTVVPVRPCVDSDVLNTKRSLAMVFLNASLASCGNPSHAERVPADDPGIRDQPHSPTPSDIRDTSADHFEFRVTTEVYKANGEAWDAFGGAPDIALCARRQNGSGEACAPELQNGRFVRPLCRDAYECRATLVLPGEGPWDLSIVDVDVAAHDTIGAGTCHPIECSVGRAHVECTSMDASADPENNTPENNDLPQVVETVRQYARSGDFARLEALVHRSAVLQTDEAGSFMGGSRAIRVWQRRPEFFEHFVDAIKVCRFGPERDEVICAPEAIPEDAFDDENYPYFIASFAPTRSGWRLQFFGRPRDLHLDELDADDE